jgi:hypothetical protein
VQHSVDPCEPDPDLVKWLKENNVPIGGLTLGALLFCLVAHYSPITIDWTRTKNFIDAFADLTQSIAFSTVGYQLQFEVVAESGYSWRATTIADKSAFAHYKN